MNHPPTLSGKVPAVSHELADFVLTATWDGLPQQVRRETLRAHLNWVACALGGARTVTADVAIRGIAAMGARGDSPVLGRAERFDMVNAALLNALHASAHAFDDTHLKTITHPTAPVAAAAWAALHARRSQGHPLSGTDLLLAVALGIEIQCRISNAILADDGNSDPGWYITGVSGGIGAALATGRLMGLGHEALVWAIGLAATQACGIRATHASMASAYVPALAARNGLTAAGMAAAGFNCGDACIDGPKGLLQVMARRVNTGPIRDGLGSSFELLETAYKPYPCGIVIHPTIDACLALAASPGLDMDQIERLDLRVHPDAIRLTGNKLPQTEMDTQVSLYHWAAAALLRQSAGLDEYALDCVQDQRVRDLQERIFALADASLASDQALASLRLRDGRSFEVRIEHASGSTANPMTNAQLERKFRAMAGPVLGAARADQLLLACLALESQDPLTIFRLGAL